MPSPMIKEKIASDAIIALLAGGEDGHVLAGQWISRLHRINTMIWALEDAVRDRGLDPPAVTATKRSIDALNLERHRMVARIDAVVDATFQPRCTLDTPGVHLNSESVGQMVDRLSILQLKREAYADRPRSAEIERRIGWLSRCLDAVHAALCAGRALPQRFDEAKTYSA